MSVGGHYRVLITGSREWSDESKMIAALRTARLESEGRKVVLICGGARGADKMAELLGRRADNCTVELYTADWATHGKAAGFIRNQTMVDSGADICLAFMCSSAANRGTQDCVRRAKKSGIRVVEVWGD